MTHSVPTKTFLQSIRSSHVISP